MAKGDDGVIRQTVERGFLSGDHVVRIQVGDDSYAKLYPSYQTLHDWVIILGYWAGLHNNWPLIDDEFDDYDLDEFEDLLFDGVRS